MALIKCEECGKEMSDKAENCPKCGAENRFIFCPDCNAKISKKASSCPKCGCQMIKISNAINTSNNNEITPKGNNFGLAIAGFVLSFFGWLAILGLVFSCIVLGTNKKKSTAKNFAIAGFVISIVWIVILFFYLISAWSIQNEIKSNSYGETEIWDW